MATSAAAQQLAINNKKRDTRQYIVINEERLISEVQRRPILYDKALKGYRKPQIREHAWQEVATMLESSGEWEPSVFCVFCLIRNVCAVCSVGVDFSFDAAAAVA